MITNEVNENIQHCIRSTASEIAEGLLIDPARKRAMEEINDRQNDISGTDKHCNWKEGKFKRKNETRNQYAPDTKQYIKALTYPFA